MPVDPTELCLQSMQRYCMQNLQKATWQEFHYGRMFNAGNPHFNNIQVRENPLNNVVSIKVDGTVVDPSEYHVDHDKLMVRLKSGCFYCCEELVLEYEAGYDPLPPDLQFVLEQATMVMQNSLGLGIVSVPGVDRIDIPDVGTVNFSTQGYGEDRGTDSLIPALKPYIGVLSSYRDTSRWRGNPTLRKISKVAAP